MKLYVEAYGCTLNQGETEMLAEAYDRKGYCRVDDPEDADLVVIGTCVVIGKTEERMRRRVAELQALCENVVVTGCLTKIQDPISGTSFTMPEEIPMTFPSTFNCMIGVIPLSSGCIGSCTYCITKLVRGELSSRPPELLIKRFSRMISDGVREIRLSCQDTASYGRDINHSLPGLLHSLLEFEGDHRIRLGMMNPDTAMDLADDLKEAMGDERIYRFLHIPLQSGSDFILERMGRRYTSDEYVEVVEYFRDSFSDLTLSTDVIAGFPGESHRDFQLTMEYIEKVRPDILNITRFSARPGTPAAEMDGKVHSRDKKERSSAITAMHKALSLEINREYIDTRTRCLVLEPGKGNTLLARTDAYKVVVIDKPVKKMLGTWVEVDIVDATDVYLKGVPI